MGFIYGIRYICSMKFAENLFPNILAQAAVWLYSIAFPGRPILGLFGGATLPALRTWIALFVIAVPRSTTA